MAKYLVRCMVPYSIVENFQKALENVAESIMVFEDVDAPPSDEMDENGFPIDVFFRSLVF